MLAFGGPLNEQVVAVQDWRDVVLVPLPVPAEVPTGALAELEPFGAAYRHGTYSVERVAYHDATRCDDELHEDGCLWEARALVYDGFPKERVTDALNAIVALASIGWR